MDEYYVTVSEKVQRKEKQTQEQIHRKVSAVLHQQFTTVSACHFWFDLCFPYKLFPVIPKPPLHLLPSKADTAPEIAPNAFDGLERVEARGAAASAEPAKSNASTQEAEVRFAHIYLIVESRSFSKNRTYNLHSECLEVFSPTWWNDQLICCINMWFQFSTWLHP